MHKRLVVAGIALLMIVIGVLLRGSFIGSVSTESPDERWADKDMDYGYVAAYFPADEGKSMDEFLSVRNELSKALTESSIEDKEDAREFIDAYSLETSVEVSGPRSKNTSTFNVTAIGGDYFYFHPMEILSGNYITENDLMEDRVVIDDMVAWFLYGSTNVAGKYMNIGGNTYYIAGVVKPHDSSAAKKTYGERNRIFISAKAYKKMDAEAKYTCYEVVYPDMITNFAYSKVRKVLGLPDESSSVEGDSAESDSAIDVVNMTTRFRNGHIWEVLCQYGERSSHTDGIIYPFWENECRRIEDFLVLVLIWTLIWVIVMLVCLWHWIRCLYTYMRSLIARVRNRLVRLR